MGERTKYHREYYRAHKEAFRLKQDEYMRRWRAANQAWAQAMLSNPWLGTRPTTAHKRAYMKQYRYERRLWTALDMMLKAEYEQRRIST